MSTISSTLTWRGVLSWDITSWEISAHDTNWTYEKRLRKPLPSPSSSLLRLIQAKSSQGLRKNRLWLEYAWV